MTSLNEGYDHLARHLSKENPDRLDGGFVSSRNEMSEMRSIGPAPSRGVSMAYDHLEQTITDLISVLDVVCEKISPILAPDTRPTAEEKSVGGGDRPVSALADGLVVLEARVQQMVDRLSMVNYRIDL